MRKKNLVVIFAVLLCAMLLMAQAAQQQKPADNGGPHAMSTNFDDLKWQTVIPELGQDSPKIAIVHADAHGTQLFIHLPKQMHVPSHWHSANETHTVVRGTATFEHEGKREQLGVGGFNYIPAKMHHQAWVSDDCVLFITVDSAWDVNWVDGPPTKSDLGKTP